MKYLIGTMLILAGWFGWWLAPTDAEAVKSLWFILAGLFCFAFNGTWEGEENSKDYWGW